MAATPGIEAAGLEEWLNVIRSDLRQRPIHHKPVKRVEIPKPGGGEATHWDSDHTGSGGTDRRNAGAGIDV